MNLGLRVRLIGTLIGAILVFFAVSAIAANQTMSNDLNKLGRREVLNGSLGFSGYWDQKKDQVRVLTQQVAIQDAIRRGVQSKNGRALSDLLTNIARQAGLSFLTVVDVQGRIVARANGGPLGAKLESPYVNRALTGETVSTAAKLDIAELRAEALAPQVATDVKGEDGKTIRQADSGLAIVASAPISDANERTVGAIYGGVVMNHFYDTVDQVTRALGGKAALMIGNAVVASSLSRADGTRLVDSDVTTGMDFVAQKKSYAGVDIEAGTPYLAQIDPILNDQNDVVAARWYGVPLAQFTEIQNNTIRSIVLWGLVGLIVALAITVPVVEALSRSLIRRSTQVRDSARELSVIVVGSEVLGDHVAQTKAAVEKQGDLLLRIATGGHRTAGGVATQNGVSDRVLAASALNAEILGDVVVIDTLAREMSDRMKEAASRVGDLNDVAEGLSTLVTGVKQ